jgi:hypothetical protein
MNTFLTKLFFCAIILTSVVLAASQASAVMITKDVLTLSITFHTQEIDRGPSAIKYKIVEKTLNTIDVLNALAKDLGVTNNNGGFGFPKGSYLQLLDKIYVVSNSGQMWDVSAYLQYTLASDVVLGHGKAPPFGPGGDLTGISFTSLVHVHFEDADHVADFTGFAHSQPTTFQTSADTSISSASGSGMLDGKPALITAQARLKAVPLGGPVPFGPISTTIGR